MKVCVCCVKLILGLQSIFPIISGHYLGGVGFEVNNYNQTSETKNYKSSFNKQRGAIKTSGIKFTHNSSFSDNSEESWEVLEDKMVSRRAILSR